jgi:hypothetical protein
LDDNMKTIEQAYERKYELLKAMGAATQQQLKDALKDAQDGRLKTEEELQVSKRAIEITAEEHLHTLGHLKKLQQRFDDECTVSEGPREPPGRSPRARCCSCSVTTKCCSRCCAAPPGSRPHPRTTGWPS